MKILIKENIQKALKKLYNIENIEFKVEEPKNKEFGDISTNIAFLIAKTLRRPPRVIAEDLAQYLKSQEEIYKKVEVAGPGFINMFLAEKFLHSQLKEILEKGEDYYKEDLGKGRKIQVEYISANPTGPLHLGHARGGAVGDTIANLLEFFGWNVVREYYINDAGNQIYLLGVSILYRYAEKLGKEEIQKALEKEFEENGYKGEYIKEIAEEIIELYGEQLVQIPLKEAIEFASEYGLNKLLNEIREDIRNFGVKFNVWFSEKSLYKTKFVEKTLSYLRKKGLLYEKEGAIWFKSSLFGDDKDRVVIKKDGSYTYFAGDIAYHYNKYLRNFYKVINVWGADHHGYIPRIKAVIKAFGGKEDWLEVVLIQMVKLYREGKEIKMSKRKGKFITLREILEELKGKDPLRFMLLTKASNTQLDFDIELAKKQSNENPVYYVQYAHARICGIFRNAKESLGISSIDIKDFNPSLLSSEEELSLIKKISLLKDELIDISESLNVHLLPWMAVGLAKDFHHYYNHNRILTEDRELTKARLALIRAIQIALRLLLRIMGVSAPERM
jgi:arginyl-tRNA synthetase